METTRRRFVAGRPDVHRRRRPGPCRSRPADQHPRRRPPRNSRLRSGRLFVDGGPRQGRADLAADHGGAVWRFASEENRARFLADPQRYLPAFGGYCAYGVAQGYLVKIDPEAWAIIDGKLYLNYDTNVRAVWLKDVPRFNTAAQGNWPKLVAQP